MRLALLLFSLTLSVAFQDPRPATSLERLVVDIWPDYDRASVLVLLTGTLPFGTQLPATVTIPVPANATLNAVARIGADGRMIDDITYDNSTAGQLTATVPESRFRIEYYVPYSKEGAQRDFVFRWQSDLSVDQLDASVQQPAMAADFTVSPAPATVSGGQDNLQHHRLPSQALLAGESFELEVRYALTSERLSAEVQAGQAPATGPLTSDTPGASLADDGFNWPVAAGAAGGLMVVAGAAWFVYSRRSAQRRIRKPRPAHRAPTRRATARQATRSVKFCHECGESVEPGDKFCRNCGTTLKSGA